MCEHCQAATRPYIQVKGDKGYVEIMPGIILVAATQNGDDMDDGDIGFFRLRGNHPDIVFTMADLNKSDEDGDYIFENILDSQLRINVAEYYIDAAREVGYGKSDLFSDWLLKRTKEWLCNTTLARDDDYVAEFAKRGVTVHVPS